MNTQRPNNRNELTDKLIAYHIGLLSEEESAEFKRKIDSDRKLAELSEQIRAILAPLDLYDVDVPDELYDNIIMQAHGTEVSTEQIIREIANEPVSRKKIIFRRFADFVATAASIALIVSAILLGTLHIRHQTRKAVCAGNLGIAGSALAAYANDFPNQLPFAKVSANQWYDRAHHKPRRPHLFILVKHRYLDPKFLICPEETHRPSVVIRIKKLGQYNDFPKGMIVSYSFQNLFGDTKFTPRQRYLRWEKAGQLAVMADKTPLLKANMQLPADIDKMLSPNHSAEGGQNILSLDGRVIWRKSPLLGVNKDNIWQAGNIRKYQGTETPASPTDVFLAP